MCGKNNLPVLLLVVDNFHNNSTMKSEEEFFKINYLIFIFNRTIYVDWHMLVTRLIACEQGLTT